METKTWQCKLCFSMQTELHIISKVNQLETNAIPHAKVQ